MLFPTVKASSIKPGVEYSTTCCYKQYDRNRPHDAGIVVPITVYYRLVQRRDDGYLIYQFSAGKPCSTYGDQLADAFEHTAFFVTKNNLYSYLNDRCYAGSEMFEHILTANEAGKCPEIAFGYPEDMDQKVHDELAKHIYFSHDEVFMYGNTYRNIYDMLRDGREDDSIIQTIGAHIDNSVKRYEALQESLEKKRKKVTGNGEELLKYLKKYNSMDTGYPIAKNDIKPVEKIKNNIFTPTDSVEVKILTSSSQKQYPDVMEWISVKYNTKKKCVTVSYGRPDKTPIITKTIIKPTDEEVSNLLYHIVELSKALDD